MAVSKLNLTWEFLKRTKIETVSCLPSNLMCMICNKILVNARQTPCGCRFCDECITEEFRKGSRKCPGKTEDCTDQLLNLEQDVIRDNNANREISKLLIKCPNNQCPHSNELRFIPEHILICEYSVQLCNKCHQTVLRRDLATHFDQQCEQRKVSCAFCGEDFNYMELVTVHNNVQHKLLCDRYESECPNQCGLQHSIIIKPHLVNCINRPEPCPFSVIGCSLVNVPRQLMNEHLSIEGHSHAKSLVTYIDNLNNEISALKLLNDTQACYIKELRDTIATNVDYEPRHNDFIWKVEQYSHLLRNAESGKTLFVESKPFLTDRYGYKMRLRLFPNGDGNGEGNYLSLFFVIIRGKYDDLLEWPFKGTVSLALLNCAKNNDYCKVGNFTALLRHNSESHVGAGCIKFFEIAQLALQGFLKNDNLYIKCSIN